MVKPISTRKNENEVKGKEELEPICQVVLFNDDINSMEYVVLCLMKVFGHPLQIAVKVMYEAHTLGKAIAEVEGEIAANRHKNQLMAYGLKAAVEAI